MCSLSQGDTRVLAALSERATDAASAQAVDREAARGAGVLVHQELLLAAAEAWPATGQWSQQAWASTCDGLPAGCTASSSTGSAAPPPPPVAAGGGKRTNYSSGNGLLRMTAAVENWLGKKGDVYTPGMEMKRYCELVEIPVETLRKYVVPDTLKRRKLRSGVGGSGQGLLDEDTAQFLVDTMRRRDRGDDGMGRKESIDMLQDLRPELSRRQVSNQFDRTIRPKYSDVLTGIVKAEATTSKRSQITVAQQYRWHTVCMPHPRAFLRPYYGNTRRHPAYCVLYDIDYYTCFYLYYVLSHPVERVVAMWVRFIHGRYTTVTPLTAGGHDRSKVLTETGLNQFRRIQSKLASILSSFNFVIIGLSPFRLWMNQIVIDTANESW